MSKVYIIGQFNDSFDYFLNANNSYYTKHYITHKITPIQEGPIGTKRYFETSNQATYIKLELIYE